MGDCRLVERDNGSFVVELADEDAAGGPRWTAIGSETYSSREKYLIFGIKRIAERAHAIQAIQNYRED